MTQKHLLFRRSTLPGEQHNRSGLPSFLLIPGLVIGGAFLACFRVPGVAARTVWAEDGAVFLQEYLEQGPGLLNPYAGYLHLLPRTIVAVVVPVFGLEAYPLAITVACCLVLGLVCALTFYCSSALTTNVAARLCWASIPVLVPPGAAEAIGNVANLHWYLLWLAPWVLLKSPSTLRQKVMLGGAALTISLTEIQAVLFLPLILFRFRDRSLWWARTGLAAGTVCQFVTLWRFPRVQGGMMEAGDTLSVVYGYFLNSTAAVFYGSGPAISLQVQHFGAASIVLSVVPFAAAALLLAVAGTGLQRVLASGFVLSSVVIWTASVVLNPAPSLRYAAYDSAEDWEGFVLGRYSVGPSMFLLALVPLLISVYAGRGSGYGPASDRPVEPSARKAFAGRKRLIGGLVGAFLMMQAVHFFPLYSLRAAGPEWAPQIQQARSACRSQPSLESVRIAQAPGNWFTTISCAHLQSSLGDGHP